MTEERGGSPAPGATAPLRAHADPVVALPTAVRPINVVLALALIHALATTVLVLGIATLALREADQFVIAWIGMGIAFGIPGAAALAVAGYRVEQALAGRRPPSAHLWGGAGAGVALVAHWLPVCALSPLLAVAAVFASGSHSDRLLFGALLAVLAWFGTAAGVVVAAASARAMARRSWAAAPVAGPMSLVPTSLAVAAAYAFAATGPALAWTAAVFDAARAGGAALAVVPWLLLGGAAGAFAGGAAGLWLRQAGRAVPRVAVGARNRQAEVAGAVLAAHGGVAFAIAMLALGGDRDLQLLIALPSALTVLAGTAVWSVGRTLRALEIARVLP